MLLSRRCRRSGTYAVAAPSFVHGVKKAALFLMLVIAAVFAVWAVIRLFGSGGERLHVANTLQVSGRGRVEVTINGKGDPQRAESGLRLYEGDQISTDGTAFAMLLFFDGTSVTLDGNSTLLLQSILKGSESSLLSMKVPTGRVFVRTGTGGGCHATL